MSILSSDNHPIRKAFRLSMNECAVLVQIVRVIHSNVGKGRFFMSKAKLADRLDLSERAVYEILNSLETRGYIKRVGVNHIEVADFILSLDRAESMEMNFIIQIEEFVLASAKQPYIPEGSGLQKVQSVQKVQSDTAESAVEGMQKVQTNNNISNNLNDNKLPHPKKPDTVEVPEEREEPTEHVTPEPLNNPSPKKPEMGPRPPSLHQAFVDRYDKWLKDHGHPGFGIDNAGRDAKGIKRVIAVVKKYVEMSMPKDKAVDLDQTTIEVWGRILAQYENLEQRDSFHKQIYLSPTMMASHFPALWDRLKELNSEAYKDAKRKRELHGTKNQQYRGQHNTSDYIKNYLK